MHITQKTNNAYIHMAQEASLIASTTVMIVQSRRKTSTNHCLLSVFIRPWFLKSCHVHHHLLFLTGKKQDTSQKYYLRLQPKVKNL